MIRQVAVSFFFHGEEKVYLRKIAFSFVAFVVSIKGKRSLCQQRITKSHKHCLRSLLLFFSPYSLSLFITNAISIRFIILSLVMLREQSQHLVTHFYLHFITRQETQWLDGIWYIVCAFVLKLCGTSARQSLCKLPNWWIRQRKIEITFISLSHCKWVSSWMKSFRSKPSPKHVDPKAALLKNDVNWNICVCLNIGEYPAKSFFFCHHRRCRSPSSLHIVVTYDQIENSSTQCYPMETQIVSLLLMSFAFCCQIRRA